MWVATRRGDTACGQVDAGRVVADGDPMLEGAEDGLFVRLVPEGGDFPVEEATAAPGEKRTSSRKTSR